jgi:ABC-type transporter Mla subunit MlaD
MLTGSLEVLAAGFAVVVLMAVCVLVYWALRLWRPETTLKTAVYATVLSMFGIVFLSSVLGLI